MPDGLITECPECQTRFNVSDGQLRLAGGKVRCGACLTVFDARAHQPAPPQRDRGDAPPAERADDNGFRFDTDAPVTVGDERRETEPPPAAPAPAHHPAPGVQQWEPPQPRHEAPPAMPAPRKESPPAPAPQEPPPRALPTLSLGDLHAEPLQLEREPEPAAPGAILGWSLGCAFALLLLVSQLLWFNRIELSRHPQLTGFYEILCNQVRCEIPPRRALEAIRNLQLVVRAHPDYEDALGVHLLLENGADFAQPFPAIDLTFSDIRGRPVSGRRLLPDDYLDPGLDPLRMTPALPYQVNLEILDPGRRAVSYEVQLAPAYGP